MGNRGKIGEDGIWELTVLATCGPNSQNSPRFSIIHWKKCKIGLKIGFGNLGSIPLEGRILRIYPAFLEFTEKIKLFLKFAIFPFFSFLSKTNEPHKETFLAIVSSSFNSDAFARFVSSWDFFREWLQLTGNSILHSTLVCLNFEFPWKFIITESGRYKKRLNTYWVIAHCFILRG